MIWREAERQVLAGRRVRRQGWADRWLLGDDFIFQLQKVNPTTGAETARHVVRAGEFGAAEFAAADWTLAPIIGTPEVDTFPLQFPGLQLWLQPPAPGVISQLDYLGPTLYQSTTSAQPVCDGVGLTFDGTDYLRTVNTASVFVGTTITVFVVASRTDLSAADRAFLDLAVLSSIRTIGTGPKLKVTYFASPLPRQVTTVADIPALHSLSVIGITTQAALAVRVNGTGYALGAVTSNAVEYASIAHVQEFAIGSLADGVTAPHAGAIREVLYYTPALSAEDYASLEAHLLTKHGLGS